MAAVERNDTVRVRIADLIRLAGFVSGSSVDSSMVTIAEAEALLGTSIVVDLRGSSMAITPHPDFPSVVAGERRRHRANLIARRSLPTPPLTSLDSRSGRAWTVDYRINWSGSAFDRTDARVRLGTPLLGGTAMTEIDRSLEGLRVRPSWTRFFPDDPRLTRIDIGSVGASSRWSAPVVGITVSNVPLYRPVIVDLIPLSGELPHGWEIDAYRDGQLVTFDSATTGGRYSMVLPVQYGENPVEFVAQGPTGEVRRFEELFRVLPAMLGTGRVEYTASFGVCAGKAECDLAGAVEARLGMTRRVTAGAGAVIRNDDRGFATVPQLSLAAQPGNRWFLDGTHVPGILSRLAMTWELTSRFRTTIEGSAHGNSAGRFGDRERTGRAALMATARWRSGKASSAPAIEVTALRTVLHNGELVDEGRMAGMMTAGAMVVRPSLRWHTAAGSDEIAPAIEFSLLPRRVRNLAVDRVWLRSNLTADRNGRLQNASLAAIGEIGSRGRMEVGARWDRPSGSSSFHVNLQAWLPTSRLTFSAASGGGTSQSAWGSMIWDQSSGTLRATSDPAFDRGGIAVHAFLDRDGDGVRGAGEEPIAGATVFVGGRAVTTRGDGRAELWGIAPWSPMEVVFDSMSLSNPDWTPAAAGYRVSPLPGRLLQVSMPVVEARSLEGRVELPSELSSRFAGMAVPLLLEGEDGTRVRSFQTFADHTFHLDQVHPGRYRILLDPEFMAIAGSGSRVSQGEIDLRIPGDSGVFAVVRVVTEEVTAGSGN